MKKYLIILFCILITFVSISCDTSFLSHDGQKAS